MDFADVSSLMENIIYLGLLYRISLYSSAFSSLLQVLKNAHLVMIISFICNSKG